MVTYLQIFMGDNIFELIHFLQVDFTEHHSPSGIGATNESADELLPGFVIGLPIFHAIVGFLIWELQKPSRSS